jgi:hypothetical protein
VGSPQISAKKNNKKFENSNTVNKNSESSHTVNKTGNIVHERSDDQDRMELVEGKQPLDDKKVHTAPSLYLSFSPSPSSPLPSTNMICRVLKILPVNQYGFV